MKYYIIAGEASGDLHGSNLMKELKKIDSSYQFRCWGGIPEFHYRLPAGAILIKSTAMPNPSHPSKPSKNAGPDPVRDH